MTSSINNTYLIVEDDGETAEFNSLYIKMFDTDANCINVASPIEAKQQLEREQPRLIIVDILYRDAVGERSSKPGLNLLRDILDDYPQLNVLVYTVEPELLRPILHRIRPHLGGFAVVNKLKLRDSFTAGVRAAVDGRYSLSPELREVADVSEEDQEILRLMCIDSLSDKEIAKQMSLSVRAVQNRIASLKQKLAPEALDDTGRNSRVAVCMRAFERRWIAK
ncbi:sigma factor-like helix-turn-helix DNA-binding protein [cf. Phormidesmis sp. LEGE 11477]|uniref:sigma factor-like helix-turn-helix DNA-binding protein n=1 Tax=cf. Phormidesmis sp. LEGE 11477 TaxID=1828680 RepID=UPI001881524D|nr:sigma factor-like helix-turn-helix DNA-binding protein [cf. Phormidesmis sp. LEGE 11477]MBE9060108.1 DNA-binding response regulator [cf. Phormidesmis sp. LEGE 11477]